MLLSFVWLSAIDITPAKYLEVALETIELNSIHRGHINWDLFRTKYLAEAADAKSVEETYPIISRALKEVDRHSFFMKPQFVKQAFHSPGRVPAIKHELLGNAVAYISIPSFSGDSARAQLFVAAIHEAIINLDEANLQGWIIDLRGNGGGNMWPMLAGLSPLLSKDTIGYFEKVDGVLNAWINRSDGIYLNDELVQPVNKTIVLNNQSRPIGVIVGPKTASSGEAVAIAFKGQEEVRFFGDRTRGLSTANKGFELQDGAMMFITTARFVDRLGVSYGKQLLPDYYTESPITEIRVAFNKGDR